MTTASVCFDDVADKFALSSNCSYLLFFKMAGLRLIDIQQWLLQYNRHDTT